MAQTVGAVLKEYAMYPVSKDRFDFLRVATELELQLEYLEMQQTLAEIPKEVYTEHLGIMTEGFLFAEAVDAATLQLLEEKVAEKLTNLQKWIKDKWDSFIAFIIKAWKALMGKIGDLNKKAKEVWDRAELKRTSFTEEERDAIAKIVHDAMQSANFPLSRKQASAGNVPKAVVSITNAGVQPRLVATFAGSNMTADPSGITGEGHVTVDSRYQKALTPAQIESLVRRMVQGDDAGQMTSSLAKFIGQNSKGIRVPSDTAELEKLISDLEAHAATLKETMSATSQSRMDAAVASKGDDMKAFDGFVKELYVSAGQSINLLKAGVVYRSKVINGIDAFLNKLPKEAA